MQPLALITGAGKRIGFTLSQHLLQRGYDLLVHTRTLTEQLQHLQETELNRVHLIPGDLTDSGTRAELLRRVQQHGNLDLLLHNASLFYRKDPDELKEEDFTRFHSIHVTVPWLLTRSLLPWLHNGRDPQVIMMTDAGLASFHGGFTPYRLSKQSLIELISILARDLAPHIRVNGIAPGRMLPPVSDDQLNPDHTDNILQREGKPEDLLTALDYLLDSPHVTGQNLRVDGGGRLEP